MKKITLLTLLAFLLLPMSLSAQSGITKVTKKDVGAIKGDRVKVENRFAVRGDGSMPQAIPVKSGAHGARRAPIAGAKTWDFEEASQLDDWTIFDKDGDGYNWEYYNNTGLETGRMNTHSGEGIVSSKSYDNNGGGVLHPDNWLISPEVTLGGGISFWACGQDASWAEEVFGVFVCVGEQIDMDKFVQVGDHYLVFDFIVGT